jgi:hypothetical protein
VVDSLVDGVRHALTADEPSGATLCGQSEPAGGWLTTHGFASAAMTYRIGCDDCRVLACEVIAAHFTARA